MKNALLVVEIFKYPGKIIAYVCMYFIDCYHKDTKIQSTYVLLYIWYY